METLASALRPLAARVSAPRVYVDANVPVGCVNAMRLELGWDVLFVLEFDDLRRARDRAHYDRARELERTLITLDRDFLDDERFPPALGAGVIVFFAPDEAGLVRLLRHADRTVLRKDDAGPLPLQGRKLQLSPCPDESSSQARA